MKPILFEIPLPFFHMSIPLSSYGTMLSLSFLVGVSLGAQDAERQGIDPNDYLTAAVYGMICVILGARLFYILQNWQSYISHLWEIIALWKGGLVFYGGFIGGTIGVGIYVRYKGIPVWKFLDASTPSIALGLFFTRIGCFLNGCCYGRPAQVPWAVRFPRGSNAFYDEIEKGLIASSSDGSLPLHPVQLYESLEGLILFLFFYLYVRKRKSFDGQSFWSFTLAYSVLRYINEIFRGDDIRGYLWAPYLSTSQFVGLIMLPLSLGMLTYLKSHRAVPDASQ